LGVFSQLSLGKATVKEKKNIGRDGGLIGEK
jgi:hypothetical protein